MDRERELKPMFETFKKKNQRWHLWQMVDG